MTTAPTPLPLSVAIVCRDNEATIGRTLGSVTGLAREIVAVDSGSIDGTPALLARAGARIIPSPWLGHVRTKQLALDHCTQPWVLCLDSDESIDERLAAALPGLVASDSGAGVGLRRVTFYRGRPLRHAWQPEFRVRLVPRGRYRWAGLDPHDFLEATDGSRAQRVDRGFIRHDSIPTFAEFLVKQAGHARIMARSMHREGKRGSVLRLAVSPAGAFLKQVVLKRAFLDGWPGWLAAGSTAAASLMKHAMLIELSREPKDEG